MRIYRVAVLVLAAIIPLPALALDCKRAASHVDKEICKSPAAKKADDAMSKAYFAVLSSTSDRAFKDALIASQRNWLSARENQEFDADGAQESFSERLRGQAVDRTEFWTRETDHKPTAIVRMETERVLLQRYPGRLAGFNSGCFIAPPHFSSGGYDCMPTIALQKNDRLCRHEIVWASGHQTEVWTVAHVGQSDATLIATCKEGYASGPECPDGEMGGEVGWTKLPGIDTPDMAELPKFLKHLDPDLDPELDDKLMACLNETEFPPTNAFLRRK